MNKNDYHHYHYHYLLQEKNYFQFFYLFAIELYHKMYESDNVYQSIFGG